MADTVTFITVEMSSNTTSEQVVITHDDGTSTVMFKDFYNAQLASQENN